MSTQNQLFLGGIFLLFVSAAGHGITNDSITPWEILQQNGGLVVKQCRGQEGTFHVDKIKLNSSTLMVQVSGTLRKELTDGHIIARITPGKAPDDANRWQRVKRKMVLSWSRAHSGKANQTEPFCSKHRHCPITAGAQKLNFSLTHLPKKVVAGSYQMQLHAYDQTGGLVVCMEGALTINHGKHGEVIRMLEDCHNSQFDPTRGDMSGDQQCHESFVQPKVCDKPEYNELVERHCRLACGRCVVATASVDASHRNSVIWALMGLLFMIVYHVF